MAFLKTDSGEFRQLPVPSILSIGRSNNNHIRPSSNQSKSVSGNHAQLILSYIPNSDKVEAYIEDLNSKFGTYVGYSPLEIEKLTGRTKLLYGFYIRLGHSPNYFQFFENIPSDAEVFPQGIVVSLSKKFHKDLISFSFTKEYSLSQTNSESHMSSNSQSVQFHPDIREQNKDDEDEDSVIDQISSKEYYESLRRNSIHNNSFHNIKAKATKNILDLQNIFTFSNISKEEAVHKLYDEIVINGKIKLSYININIRNLI